MITCWRTVLLSLVIVGFASQATAQEKKAFYQDTKSKIERTIKAGDKVTTQKQKTRLVAELTPEEGPATFKYKLLKIEVQVDSAGKVWTYDSAKPTEGPAAGFFKHLVGLELSVKVEKDGKLKFKNLDKLLEGSSGKSKKILEKFVNEQLATGLLAGGIAQFPSQEPKADKTWQTETLIDLAHLGLFTVTTTATNEGPDPANKKLELVKLDAAATYKAAEATTEAQHDPGFRIKSAEFKVANYKGKYLYNPETRWLDSADFSLELDGKLTIESAGTTTEATVAVKHTSITKVTDKQP